MKVKNNLYKRGNSWYILIRIDGRQVRKSFGPDKRAAEIVLAELKKQQAIKRASNSWSGLDKLFEPKSQITFAEAATQYMVERTSNKESTIQTYNEHLNNYLLPEFGHKRIRDIRESDIAIFRGTLVKRLSASRTNSTVNLMRSILETCKRRKLIEENPAAGVKRLEETPVEINPLTHEELDSVLKCISTHYRPIFECLAWTGARPGELKALKWKHVRLGAGYIDIKAARRKGAEGAPKTRSSIRQIRMLEPVQRVMNELRANQSVRSLDDSDYVFVDTAGGPINRGLDDIWARALRKAGLAHRPSYQLRHTFASLCLQQGCDPGWVKEMLGHSTLATTFKHYGRYIKGRDEYNQANAARLFDRTVEAARAL